MITFIVHVKVRPENATEFEALMMRVRDLTCAHEPGVAHYDFVKCADEDGIYAVVEVYRDAAAHAAHMQTRWVLESIPITRRLVEGKFDIRQYVSPGTEPVARRMKEA